MAPTPLRLDSLHDNMCEWTTIGFTRKACVIHKSDFEVCASIPDEADGVEAVFILHELYKALHFNREDQ